MIVEPSLAAPAGAQRLTLPYADDSQPHFAYFVADPPQPYVASVAGLKHHIPVRCARPHTLKHAHSHARMRVSASVLYCARRAAVYWARPRAHAGAHGRLGSSSEVGKFPFHASFPLRAVQEASAMPMRRRLC